MKSKKTSSPTFQKHYIRKKETEKPINEIRHTLCAEFEITCAQRVNCFRRFLMNSCHTVARIWNAVRSESENKKTAGAETPAENMVRPKGLEPLTFWSVAKRSIQLSHGRVFHFVRDMLALLRLKVKSKVW